MNARHRVSKMLLRHGRVYPKAVDLDPGAPPVARRASSSPSRVSELAYADLVACVDGLTARKHALAERI